jgi:hypothetical protein
MTNTTKRFTILTGTALLYGDGSSTSPHYWAWVPAGSTPPPPPPLPRAQR